MHIREARTEDAAAICRVLRRSITELCVPDHGNDPAILARWLANKTPDTIAGWITAGTGYVFVAVEGNEILGVGGLLTSGEITLNYISPDARFRGVSKALLVRLEAQAAALGLERVILTSTATARQFYLSAGYLEQRAPSMGLIIDTSLRMTKELMKSYPA